MTNPAQIIDKVLGEATFDLVSLQERQNGVREQTYDEQEDGRSEIRDPAHATLYYAILVKSTVNYRPPTSFEELKASSLPDHA